MQPSFSTVRFKPLANDQLQPRRLILLAELATAVQATNRGEAQRLFARIYDAFSEANPADAQGDQACNRFFHAIRNSNDADWAGPRGGLLLGKLETLVFCSEECDGTTKYTREICFHVTKTCRAWVKTTEQVLRLGNGRMAKSRSFWTKLSQLASICSFRDAKSALKQAQEEATTRSSVTPGIKPRYVSRAIEILGLSLESREGPSTLPLRTAHTSQTRSTAATEDTPDSITVASNVRPGTPASAPSTPVPTDAKHGTGPDASAHRSQQPLTARARQSSISINLAPSARPSPSADSSHSTNAPAGPSSSRVQQPSAVDSIPDDDAGQAAAAPSRRHEPATATTPDSSQPDTATPTPTSMPMTMPSLALTLGPPPVEEPSNATSEPTVANDHRSRKRADAAAPDGERHAKRPKCTQVAFPTVYESLGIAENSLLQPLTSRTQRLGVGHFRTMLAILNPERDELAPDLFTLEHAAEDLEERFIFSVSHVDSHKRATMATIQVLHGEVYMRDDTLRHDLAVPSCPVTVDGLEPSFTRVSQPQRSKGTDAALTTALAAACSFAAGGAVLDRADPDVWDDFARFILVAEFNPDDWNDFADAPMSLADFLGKHVRCSFDALLSYGNAAQVETPAQHQAYTTQAHRMTIAMEERLGLCRESFAQIQAVLRSGATSSVYDARISQDKDVLESAEAQLEGWQQLVRNPPSVGALTARALAEAAQPRIDQYRQVISHTKSRIAMLSRAKRASEHYGKI